MLKQSINYKQQKGFTMIGWAFVLAIFLFFAYLALLIAPVIMANHTTTTILESLKNEPGITKKSKRDILRLLDSRLLVNQVTNISKDDFDIVKEGSTLDISLEYDDKVHFAGDIYIVFERNKFVEIIGN
ncbi:MAG: DUF4845 domain-containing protein [Gammaproteobacteria bacterium]|nr:DUF4845 domain-containing protein [Gammaproteobacteria bacterium]